MSYPAVCADNAFGALNAKVLSAEPPASLVGCSVVACRQAECPAAWVLEASVLSLRVIPNYSSLSPMATAFWQPVLRTHRTAHAHTENGSQAEGIEARAWNRSN